MDMKNMRIQKRLTTSFFIVAILLSIVGIAAAIALFIMGRQYSGALQNYGFAQGDVGMMLTEFADMRSCTRAIIGYSDQEMVQDVYEDYQETRAEFEKAMATVKEGLVTEDGKRTFAQVETAVNKYLQIEEEVQAMAGAGDAEKNLAAQEKAYTEMG